MIEDIKSLEIVKLNATCSSCGEYKPGEVEERYSFDIYAGRLCIECCFKYRDHCGVDQAQRNPCTELDEQIDPI